MKATRSIHFIKLGSEAFIRPGDAVSPLWLAGAAPATTAAVHARPGLSYRATRGCRPSR
ncbi:hypothetical protein [Oryza sativa Japonica Group]|uniref:Uncharacterized protein n=1 Tax=Oryza sativa subsp. japonica TaxID=39947 RepID=Q5N9P0_ORYSJ|nr:hypothetical protein [Oryza sativa Japonica Group]BAD81817.1 hypothetical protein [Oryza sativa Japonica Group]